MIALRMTSLSIFTMARQFGLNHVARAAVAMIWLYHGLWCKLFGGSDEQLRIVADVPGLAFGWGQMVFIAIGIVEVGIAGWMLIGRHLRAAAIVQTLLLAGMNSAGLWFAADRIADPIAMLLNNLVLIVLVWLLAAEQEVRHARR